MGKLNIPTRIRKSKSMGNYPIRIDIIGASGSGRTTIFSLIWKTLSEAKLPHGFDRINEHSIYCDIKK